MSGSPLTSGDPLPCGLLRFRTLAVVLAGLALAGAALSPLREAVGKDVVTPPGAAGTGRRRPVTAHWVNAAVPGGLRALVADGLWLRLYSAWAARDIPRTEALVCLVTMADDRPAHFWINGARILACDIAEWRLSAAGSDRMPAEVQRRIVDEQACAGLRHLAAACACHPDNAAIWVETGNIQLYRRGNWTLAAEAYRRAAELPGAPWYAARIHAELLRRLGRDKEAYVWLRRLHPALPAGEPAAMSGVVLFRIRMLEDRLRVPPEKRYVPPGDSR